MNIMTALFDQDEVIGLFANGAAYAKHSRAKSKRAVCAVGA